MARPRSSSDHCQLAVRIADVGVSAFTCECNIFKTIVLCGCFRDNSVVFFLIAFGFMCLQNSGVAARSVIVTVCGIILILAFWCIWTSRRKREPSNADGPKRTTLNFEEELAKRKKKGFIFKRQD